MQFKLYSMDTSILKLHFAKHIWDKWAWCMYPEHGLSAHPSQVDPERKLGRSDAGSRTGSSRGQISYLQWDTSRLSSSFLLNIMAPLLFVSHLTRFISFLIQKSSETNRFSRKKIQKKTTGNDINSLITLRRRRDREPHPTSMPRPVAISALLASLYSHSRRRDGNINSHSSPCLFSSKSGELHSILNILGLSLTWFALIGYIWLI